MNIFQEAKQILDKDGKVNPLGPYGKSKLTGQEVAQYFRKNKVSDSKIKKAVEVALDLGGAMDIARKEIQKFYGDKILKSKEVQSALKFANEETVNEIFGISQDPRYRAKVMKMLDDEGIKYKKDGRNALIILGVAPKDQKKLLDRIHKQFGMSSYSMIDESRASARRDAMRGMSADPDFQPKGFKDIKATDADRKAASKNVLMQIRKATDLPKGGEIEFPSGKKGKISQADAKKVDKMFNVLKKPQDKEKFQKVISKDLNSIKNLLKRLGR